MGQTNLKRMVAYSSVSHMGLIFLGIATMQPLGIAGALFMMFAHGIISPLLFAVAGAFKHHYHTLEIGSMRESPTTLHGWGGNDARLEGPSFGVFPFLGPDSWLKLQ
ncbi:MAG: hypothetical protein Ct9H90mP14_3380 [Methanobacteriota archaeon]|nr:MAG: hypothetical protein Ct9H90mP14_3380 [Euryarchaeota archaeon]